MIDVLLVAATAFELNAVANALQTKGEWPTDYEGLRLDALVTGIGAVHTAAALTARLLRGEAVRRVLNVGVAGSFRRDWALGTVLQLVSDQWGDLGYELREGGFRSFVGELLDGEQPPYKNGRLWAYDTDAAMQLALKDLPVVTGLTVNRVHGQVNSIAEAEDLFGAEVESMEGAAVFLACGLLQVPAWQVRSLSNYVEPRRREAWQMGLALRNLGVSVAGVLARLATQKSRM